MYAGVVTSIRSIKKADPLVGPAKLVEQLYNL
jgi:hypothetical protein